MSDCLYPYYIIHDHTLDYRVDYLHIESDILCSVPLVVFVPPNNQNNKLNSIIYYQSSPLTFTGLRIGYNQGKCSDT